MSGSGSQEEDQTDTKSKSQKHCLKRTINSSTESSATIYQLQKIMNIEAPLMSNIFKTYELKKKKSMNIKARLNVHNFKTKPPFDKWSIPYDIRGLQNPAFGEKWWELRRVSKLFRKAPTEAKKKKKKIMNKDASWKL